MRVRSWIALIASGLLLGLALGVLGKAGLLPDFGSRLFVWGNAVWSIIFNNWLWILAGVAALAALRWLRLSLTKLEEVAADVHFQKGLLVDLKALVQTRRENVDLKRKMDGMQLQMDEVREELTALENRRDRPIDRPLEHEAFRSFPPTKPSPQTASSTRGPAPRRPADRFAGSSVQTPPSTAPPPQVEPTAPPKDRFLGPIREIVVPEEAQVMDYEPVSGMLVRSQSTGEKGYQVFSHPTNARYLVVPRKARAVHQSEIYWMTKVFDLKFEAAGSLSIEAHPRLQVSESGYRILEKGRIRIG